MNQDKTFLGTEPIGKLLRQLAIPTVIAQLVNMLYNIVDRIYIGHIPGDGDLALTGVGVCLPLILIVSAFAALVASGGAPRASIYMGKQDHDTAEKILGGCFALQLAVSALLTAVLLLWSRDLLLAFGASENTIGYAASYMQIYAVGTVFVQLTLGLNAFITAQGFAKIGMRTVLIGAVANIVLDPIFIYGLHMGVRGAALATILSQGLSCIWVLRFLTGRRALLRLKASCLRLKASRVRRILGLGMSGFAMAMTNSLVQILCNASLQLYGGDLYVGIMTIINSVREVISMPVQGITNGCQPVLGYNYGAEEYDRVRQGIRFTAVVTMLYSLAVWAMTLAIPGSLIRIFNDEADLIAAGIPAFRIYFAAFFCMSFQFIGQSTFVGLGKSRFAVFFSLLRKAFIVAPLTLLLPVLGMGVDGVFWAEPISNVVGGLACLLTMYCTVYRPLGRLEASKP